MGLVANIVGHFLNGALNPPLTEKCLLDGLDHIVSVVVENKQHKPPFTFPPLFQTVCLNPTGFGKFLTNGF